jgi:ribosomal protein L37AE/L43A
MNLWQGLISLGLIGFFWWLIQNLISSGKREAHLKANITLLNKEIDSSNQDISKLEKENAKLKEQTTEIPLLYDQNIHYYTDDSNHRYCPSCYETKHLRIHIVPQGKPLQYWSCPVCKHTVDYPGYQPPPEVSSYDSDRFY